MKTAVKTLPTLALMTLAACSPRPPTSADAQADATGIDASEDSAIEASAPDSGCTFTGAPEPQLADPARYTPRWAFEPWISKDISNTADTYAFVEGFRSRNIPVGVVVIDSPWETQYNTFVPSDVQYPQFRQLVTDLRAMNIRTVLWITQMVNSMSFDAEAGSLENYLGASPNFSEGRRCGFYVNDGAQYTWWKGRGAAVDFFNGRARTWWHAQQNLVLDMGIAGWKLDFGETYVRTETVRTAIGEIPHQRYSEEYYRDFLAYGVSRRGREEFLTMVRPYDKSYEFPGRFFARPEHTPVGWVGDNRRDWIGLKDALDHVFRSARAGYVVLGSDIGGYLDRNDENLLEPPIPFDSVNFARWTAVSAFMPFFQLHGRANITPWTVPERTAEVVQSYAYYARLHHALVPFFFSLAQEAYAMRTTPTIRPVGELADWTDDYRFGVGDAFFVAPLLDGTGRRNVTLPTGAAWLDWWSPSAAAIAPGSTVTFSETTTIDRIPVYLRDGAIVPMNIEYDGLGVGNQRHRGATTVLFASASREALTTRFALHNDGAGQIANVAFVRDNSTLTLSAQNLTGPVIVALRGAPMFSPMGFATSATRAEFDSATGNARFVDADQTVYVRVMSTGSFSLQSAY
ncbi:MAG: glycoside hydrolase family 31 protein [Deltaproteobacteria bacterium]|nr:glycoside hydrolase family 31 protein [Deltaproteobacteria bacterium]